MSAQSKYHKKTGYSAQKKWKEAHAATIAAQVSKQQKEILQAIADEKGIPLSQLIKQALDAQYGLALSKQKDDPPAE